MQGKILREKYRIKHKMGGKGGFGETFIAESLSSRDDKLYVVKKLKPTITDPRIWEQFSKEASVLKELGQFHPLIPEVYDYFQQNREYYLIQEHIDGHDLTDEILPGKRWIEAQTKDFLVEILEILAFVHNRGILHMDIKPANIMRRNSDRQLMLIDFGSVKRTSTQVIENGKIRINPNSLVFCTPGYAPIEQLHCKPHFYSSDIYAVGITAIQALTGISAIELSKENGTVIWRDEVSNYVSNAFADFLSKMVSFDYTKRYQNAKVALDELLKIPDNDNETTIPSTPPILTKKPDLDTIPPIEYPNGPVPLNSPFYIERCKSNMYGRSTALRRIKAPRKWGKTSATIRKIEHERQEGFHIVCLNFREFDTDTSQNLSIFLQKFCESIILELNNEELQIKNNVAEFWQNSLAPNNKTKCRLYIQKYILNVINKPLVIVLDEVDRIFGNSQIDTEFFALLRVFYERSASEEVWQKLKMVIVHSQNYTETSKNKSPFNVGESIELPEFDESQIKKLLELHGLNWQPEQIKQLIELVGGHPYMVRLALYKIANQEMTFSEFLELAAT
ncbi:MAG: serine/threonine-protein kinase, partial [Cyanobacteria bacterium J06635_10]